MTPFEPGVVEAMPIGFRALRIVREIDELRVSNHLVGEPSVADLQARCSTVGLNLARRVLPRQRDAGRVECLGRGPRARWRRIGRHVQYSRDPNDE